METLELEKIEPENREFDSNIKSEALLSQEAEFLRSVFDLATYYSQDKYPVSSTQMYRLENEDGTYAATTSKDTLQSCVFGKLFMVLKKTEGFKDMVGDELFEYFQIFDEEDFPGNTKYSFEKSIAKAESYMKSKFPNIDLSKKVEEMYNTFKSVNTNEKYRVSFPVNEENNRTGSDLISNMLITLLNNTFAL
jgi:hypothetical protein